MPSVRYYNQTAPFWDFVASLEDQGASHPWFANRGETSESNNETEITNQPTGRWPGFPFGPAPHRGRGGRLPHHGRRGPPPPPADGEMPDAPPATEREVEVEAGPSEPHDAPQPISDSEQPTSGDEARKGPGARGGHGFGRGRGGAGATRGRGGAGATGGRGGAGGLGGRGGAGATGGRGGAGGHGGRGHHHGRGGFGGFPMGRMGGLAGMFQNQIFGDENTKDKSEGFTPEVDVFDAPESFVVHVSLPGAKKEDVGVNWDAEKSELNIAGVVYRPGSEDFLKSLALDERKVGAFERKVRLGSRANPAQVDIDAITARMEDGILRIDVSKLDSGYVEIKKVDIE